MLPLDNLSGNPAQDPFADGVTEALIGQLAQIRALKVASRTSVMAFKGSQLPLPDIARGLGVDAVLHGSVQQSGDRIRIGVRLIDGRTDTHLWARDYERDASEILRLQAVVAQAVADEIRIQVTPEERARLAAAGPVAPAAYQEYSIGRYHLWRDSEEHLRTAIAHFERATRIDSQYAAAYASLAHAWWKLGLWGDIGLAATESPARLAVNRALQLDDALPDAYVVLADLERVYARDLVRAEELVTRAPRLEPHHADAHYTYALLLMTAGRFREAIAHMETAEGLDPLAPVVQSDFGRVLYRAGNHDEAVRRLNRALELEPAMGWLVHWRLADVYTQMGQYDRALNELAHSGATGPSYLAQRARILARAGDHTEARRLLNTIEADVHRFAYGEIPPVAAAYVALGDGEAAFALLFDMLERADPGPEFLAVDPPFGDLHADPRWAEIVRLARLPREARRTPSHPPCRSAESMCAFSCRQSAGRSPHVGRLHAVQRWAGLHTWRR